MVTTQPPAAWSKSSKGDELKPIKSPDVNKVHDLPVAPNCNSTLSALLSKAHHSSLKVKFQEWRQKKEERSDTILQLTSGNSSNRTVTNLGRADSPTSHAITENQTDGISSAKNKKGFNVRFGDIERTQIVYYEAIDVNLPWNGPRVVRDAKGTEVFGYKKRAGPKNHSASARLFI